MRRSLVLIAFAAAMTTACGGSDPTATAPSVLPQSLSSSGERLSTRDFVQLQCGDVTYVGPIRLPISVHGTTVDLSWLGNDNATRGYEVQFEILNATNQWLPALTRIVTSPEIDQFLSTEATYRVRVRGLFCGDAIGPFTDWQIFSTDGAGGDAPIIVPPPICPTSVEGCYPPPPPPPGDDDDNDDDHGHHDDGPPPFEQYQLCHVEFHPGHGGKHPVPDSYTEQQKTIHSQGEANGHANHEFDYIGTCDGRYND